MSEPTCWTLIHGAATGDEEACDAFARCYQPAIQAYLRARWGNRLAAEELEDAMQEVFVECLREHGALGRAQKGRGDGFRAYLFGIVGNVARRYESRGGRRRDAPRSRTFHADDHAAAQTSLSYAFDRAWATSMLGEARARMETNARAADDRHRKRVEILRLRFEEGLTLREIARRWDVDTTWMGHEYQRALRDYHSALKEVVGFHHPGAPERVQEECAALLKLVP